MADKKQKVRFLRFYEVQDDSGTSYDEGEVVALSEGSALHFTKRGIAENVSQQTKVGKAKAEADPEKDGDDKDGDE